MASSILAQHFPRRHQSSQPPPFPQSHVVAVWRDRGRAGTPLLVRSNAREAPSIVSKAWASTPNGSKNRLMDLPSVGGAW
jgi:hypothetical protein